jgi:2-polyprenyl-6-methoxyphenol hydroxylase-like FAD-dependent oxidoreductase
MTTHAVVIGASIAGLCAGRVLARSFDKVTLLERDELPEGPELRAGVPQGRHVHALITRGARELERLFPGFCDELRALGAHELDVPHDGAVLRACGWQRPMASGHKVFFATRSLTESIVRRRVLAIPNLEIEQRCEVSGLLVRPDDPSRVRGVRVQWRGQASGPAEIEADLVVDASGRASKAPEWLAAIGRPAPREELVDAGTGYSSRWYEGPDPALKPSDYWWRLIWLDPKPPNQLLGGVLFPVEGGRFIVTLIGYSRQFPPSDEAAFERALHDVRSPVLARTVALSRPISPVYSYRGLVNRLRRFDTLEDPAPGFVALGDSVCTFNPMYGQGMTIATLCVAALEDTLAHLPGRDPGFPRAFFKAQARSVRDAWSLATGADMLFPATKSERPPPTRFARLYSEALRLAMNNDQEVLRRVSPVYYLLRPNRDVLERGLAARILAVAARELLKKTLRRAPLAPMPPPRA